MSPPPSRLITTAFVLAFIANFANSMAFFLFVHLPGLLVELEADDVEIGTAIATLSGVAITVRPFVGWVMDRRGRRGILVAGAIFHAAGCAMYLGVDGVNLWLYATRTVHGLAAGMLFSALFTIAADVVPAHRRAEGIALFGLSGMMPLALGPMLGDFILARASYRELFLTAVGLALVTVIAAVPLHESRPEPSTRPRSGFWTAATQPDLRPLWLAGLSFSFAVSAYFVFVKPFVQVERLGDVSAFFTPYAIAAIVIRVAFGKVPERFGLKRTLFPSIVILAVGVLCIGFSENHLMLRIAGTCCGIGHGFAFPVLSALIVNRTPESERGSAMSLLTALFDLGVLVGGPVLGAIAEASSYQLMFRAAAGIAFTSLLIFAWWDRKSPD